MSEQTKSDAPPVIITNFRTVRSILESAPLVLDSGLVLISFPTREELYGEQCLAFRDKRDHQVHEDWWKERQKRR